MLSYKITGLLFKSHPASKLQPPDSHAGASMRLGVGPAISESEESVRKRHLCKLYTQSCKNILYQFIPDHFIIFPYTNSFAIGK